MVAIIGSVRTEVVKELAVIHVAVAVLVLAAAEPENGVVEDVWRAMRRKCEARGENAAHHH